MFPAPLTIAQLVEFSKILEREGPQARTEFGNLRSVSVETHFPKWLLNKRFLNGAGAEATPYSTLGARW